jgi:putative hemolysin
MRQLGVVQGGDAAASLWRRLSGSHLAPIHQHVQPRLPLPLHRFDGGLEVQTPALVQAWLRLGARLLGPPAWHPDFDSADLPMLLRTDALPAHWRRRFPRR